MFPPPPLIPPPLCTVPLGISQSTPSRLSPPRLSSDFWLNSSARSKKLLNLQSFLDAMVVEDVPALRPDARC